MVHSEQSIHHRQRPIFMLSAIRAGNRPEEIVRAGGIIMVTSR
jgi:hypothetical protein